MSTFTVVIFCVGVLAALCLSFLVPVLRLPASSSSSTALLEAAYVGDLSEVRRLLAAHVNQSHSQQLGHGQQQQPGRATLPRDSNNNTALHVCQQIHTLPSWAVKEARPNSLAIVDALVAAGASLSAVNAAGTSPLHWAVHSDSDALISAVLQRLCPHTADNQRAAPTPATQQRADQLPVCAALVTRNGRNETALHWAVDWQRPIAVSTLLRAADASRGSSASVSSASRELVDSVDVNGDTPLHRLPIDCPQSASCRLIAQQLIARGANVTAENAAHRTPLAHFPTPTSAAAPAAPSTEEEEQFRRNITQHFNTLR